MKEVMYGLLIVLLLVSLLYPMIKHFSKPKSDRLVIKARNYIRKKNTVKAKDAFKEAYKINKFKTMQKSEIALQVSLCYIEMGETGKAVAWAEKAKSARLKDPHMWATLGRAYYDFGDINKALGAFLNKANLVTDDINVYSMIAACYAKIGDERQANIAVNKAQECHYPNVQVLKGVVKKELNNYKIQMQQESRHNIIEQESRRRR